MIGQPTFRPTREAFLSLAGGKGLIPTSTKDTSRCSEMWVASRRLAPFCLPMNSFKLNQYEKGKCRRCGADVPDRFWSPHYCWSCKRKLTSRNLLIVVAIFALLVVFAITLDFRAIFIFGIIEALVIWVAIKHVMLNQ